MQHWKDMGWDVDYIINESLKWHISSFNGKSSVVPKEWWPQVNRWLKKMGYRFVLRKFTYSAAVKPSGKLDLVATTVARHRALRSLPMMTDNCGFRNDGDKKAGSRVKH
jgi:hypothetical protein